MRILTRYKIEFYILSALFLLFPSVLVKAQTDSDTLQGNRWTIHYQNTVIDQGHPTFNASYSGINSLHTYSESATSMTGTLFTGLKLWKNTSVYFNPEISGGSGLSKTEGMAAFPNGEIYRVSDVSPTVYLARLYLRKVFPLTNTYQKVSDTLNVLEEYLPTSYIDIYAGKFSVMDFFDSNSFSHDPRSQFYNWALMGNGSWDYPANTRGYTQGFAVEIVKLIWAMRFAEVMVAQVANGPVMDNNILRSHGEVLEFQHNFSFGSHDGIIRLLGYLNEARMGNYLEAIQWGIQHNTTPAVDSTKALGRSKFGFGINIEYNLFENTGLFLRAGWNDGKNETWMFTEIDRSISLGLQESGVIWKRPTDKLGFALLSDLLSANHEAYLKAGGIGFMIGDGKLNYQPESILELYYSFQLCKFPLWISPDYQFVLNPGYNADRGPVHIFGLRVHLQI